MQKIKDVPHCGPQRRMCGAAGKNRGIDLPRTEERLMKNALTRKLLAAAAAIVIVASMTGCFAAPAAPQNNETTPAVTTSASDTVSGADVASGADVVVIDDATAANNAIEAYLNGFNTGDAAKLADVTYSPAVAAFLESNGKDKSFLAGSFQTAIDEMKQSAGGVFYLDYEYTVSEASEEQFNQLKAEIEALAVGSGEKVQAARIGQVSMKANAVASASDVTSSGDLVSGADVSELESTKMELRLYKYDGKWYVFAV